MMVGATPVRMKPLDAQKAFGIHLYGDHLTACARHFGQDGRVVVHAASQMEDAIPWLYSELIDPARQRSRLATDQVARRIERRRHVVINVPRVGIVGRHICRARADVAIKAVSYQLSAVGRSPILRMADT